jgi:hypothetical protein
LRVALLAISTPEAGDLAPIELFAEQLTLTAAMIRQGGIARGRGLHEDWRELWREQSVFRATEPNFSGLESLSAENRAFAQAHT